MRLVTSAGTIPAKVVQVDAANDLALLKADGRFACCPLPPVARGFWAHGGDGRFSRHRFAGVRAQGAGARPPRGNPHRALVFG